MQGYVRVMRSISQLCGFIAAGMIAAGVIVVCEMVILRYAFGQSTIWQTDFTTYCLIAATRLQVTKSVCQMVLWFST